MAEVRLSEKEFLITYALKIFNEKYGRNLLVADCGISSVEPTYGATYGYQICTLREDDHVRIFLYFDIGQEAMVHWCRIEDEQNMYRVSAPGDEVYVILATMSDYWTKNLIYYFRAMYCECSGPAQPMGIPFVEGGVICSAEGPATNICYIEDTYDDGVA